MSQGRPIEFNRDDAATAAMHVFWERGYQAASTRELLGAMSLSRSSLYQAFGNKEELFLDALRRYREDLLGALRRQLDQSPSALAFLEELFMEMAREAGTSRAARGCLIFNSATELGQRGDAPAAQAAASVRDITRLLAQAVSRAQAEGDIDGDRDADALADYLTVGLAGFRTLLKSGVKRLEAERTARMILEALS